MCAIHSAFSVGVAANTANDFFGEITCHPFFHAGGERERGEKRERGRKGDGGRGEKWTVRKEGEREWGEGERGEDRERGGGR